MATALTIAILDDEADRLRAMREVITRFLPDYDFVFFRTAPEIIRWFKKNLSEVVLISLDHDLIPLSPNDPEMGSGRDVADYLATRSPVCHVIIHTTNSLAAPGMELVLNDSGWETSRVHPYNDLEWVTSWWIREVKTHL